MVELMEVSTQGLHTSTDAPLSVCLLVRKTSPELIQNVQCWFCFFSSTRCSMVASQSLGWSLEDLRQLLFVLGVTRRASSHRLVWLGQFFLGRRGEKTIEMPHLSYLQLHFRSHGKMRTSEARTRLERQLEQELVFLLIERDLMHCELDVTWGLFVKINYIKYI